MRNNNAFTLAGKKERVHLLALYAKVGITDFSFTDESGYDRVEGFFTTAKGRKFVVEAKVRNDSSTRYPNHLIEKKKFDVLAEYYKEGYTPLYINFFTDGKAIMYNLSLRIKNNTESWVTQKCRATTAGTPSNYIDKLIANLTFDETIGDRTV